MKAQMTEPEIFGYFRKSMEWGAPLTSDYLKGCARVLCREGGRPRSLAHALEDVAKAFGYASWNAAKAVLPSETDRPLPRIGEGRQCFAKIVHPEKVADALNATIRAAEHTRPLKIVLIRRDDTFKVPDPGSCVLRNLLLDHLGDWEAWAHTACRRAFYMNPDLIVLPNIEDVSDVNSLWDTLNLVAYTGHTLLLGHRGVLHPPRFVRVGVAPDGAAYMPIW